MDGHRLAQLTSLGLYDPAWVTAADRLALLELLDADGASDAEMVEAQAGGRLFALAGDRIAQPGEPTHTTEGAARALALEPAAFERIWQAIGLPMPAAGELEITDSEVEGLTALTDVAALLGIDAAVRVSRVVGAAVARIAEAESSITREALRDIDLGVSQSEVATAVAWRSTAELIPKVGRLLDVIHRRQLALIRPYFESIDVRNDGREATLGVGFVDLSGFTALAATTSLPSLSRLLSVFESRAADTVMAGGGRLVKYLGDAVMFIAADRTRLAAIALDLVGDTVAAEAGIAVRGGIAWGDVLIQDGDYFGSTVNLAARLVSVAAPSTLLGSPELAGVEGVDTAVLAPMEIRGFARPIAPVQLSRRTAATCSPAGARATPGG